MIFNKHFDIEGKHALLSPSQYHWLNYTEEKLVDRYYNWKAAERGTRIHALAAELIAEGIKLPRTNQTHNMYVNDGIGFKMQPEQPLKYSENCFGTADTIIFKNNLLRIHDLKTGVTPASMKQLEIYAAIFCLEYNYKPTEIEMELRIYQNDEKIIHKPESEEIFVIMDKIIFSDKLITELKEKE